MKKRVRILAVLLAFALLFSLNRRMQFRHKRYDEQPRRPVRPPAPSAAVSSAPASPRKQPERSYSDPKRHTGPSSGYQPLDRYGGCPGLPGICRQW
jgi:hypothetical protein